MTTWLELAATAKQGDRVRFVEAWDIFPIALVRAGTVGTVEENNLNEAHCILSVRPDDEALSDLLAEWDGCIYLGEQLRPGVEAEGWNDPSPLALGTGVIKNATSAHEADTPRIHLMGWGEVRPSRRS